MNNEKRSPPVYTTLCRTDVNRIIRYLDDAAHLYEQTPRQSNLCRAWCIRQITKKLRDKIP